MPSAPLYRALETSALAAARRLWQSAEGVELAEGDTDEEWASYLARNPGFSQVAQLDGELVGAVLAGHDGRRGYLYHLAVAPAQRGAGIGRHLVDRALDCLRQAGLKRVLILVARDNPRGQQFWQRAGWEALTFAEPRGLDL